MFICDGCQQDCDFGTSIGGLVLCDECVMPYDEAMLKCRSQREYASLGRRVRVEVLRSRDKACASRSVEER